MRTAETYCLPVQEEVIETAFKGERSLEILESAVNHSSENPTLSELAELSSEPYSTTSHSISRLDKAGLLDKTETDKSKKYELNDTGYALAALYSERGISAFKEVMSDAERLIYELENNGKKAVSSSLYEEGYSPGTVNELLEQGRLARQELSSDSILHLPDVEITEKEKINTIQGKNDPLKKEG